MSELIIPTTRTDEEVNDAALEDKNHPHTDWVTATFARTLERECHEHFKIKQRAVVQNVKYRTALIKIRDMDYRGNRSTESKIALEALNE